MKQKILFLLILFAFTAIPLFSQTGAKICTDISVTLSDENPGVRPSVTISWKNPQTTAIESILLYRDTKHISKSSIKFLTPLESLPRNTEEYTDKPKDSKKYFYAALPVFYKSGLLDLIVPGVNATVNAVSAVPKKVEPYVAGTKRPVQQKDERSNLPLPDLNIMSRNEDKKGISDEAVEIAARAGRFIPNKETKSLYVFPEDKALENTSGEQYLLSKIITSSFMQNDWDTAEFQLQQFLKTNHSDAITRRANFYLGQTLYYQGYYREALNAFIIAEDSFPAKTKQWIQAVLEKM